MSLVRSISGLRATLSDDLVPELVAKYAASFAKMLPAGKIVVGNDGRPSHEWIENVLVGSLLACGRDVVRLGTVPTPTVQLFAEKGDDVVGGVAITASHNPSQWNGLKFVNASGVFLNAAENAVLWDILDNGKFVFSADKFGKILDEADPLGKHIGYVLQMPLLTAELKEKICKRRLHVVVDAVNASGSVIVPQLLRKFGCEVVELFCDKSGVFPHTPEPLPVNLTQLAEAVKLNKADLGIAVDPDADRLVLIDETGSPIGEEKTICLAIDAVLRNAGAGAACAVNHSTTMLADYVAEKHGCKCFRSPVGEINVVGKMKDVKAVIGGEGSGGVISAEVHYGRDSLVGITLVLSLMALKNKTLGEIAGEYPKYVMKKTKYPFSGSLDEYISKINAEFAVAEIIHEDGIKVLTNGAWVQLRKSNTEPIIRVIAEALEAETVENLLGKVTGILNV